MAGKDRSWVTIVLLGAVLLAIAFIFLGESWVMNVIEKERRYNYAFYSNESAALIEERATRWYQKAFVDTNIIGESFNQFSRSKENLAVEGPFDGTGMALYSWYESRARAFWALIFQAFLRVSQLYVWLPLAMVIAIPWIIDGLVSRKVRQHTYKQSSHLEHHYALMGMSIISLGMLAMIITPIAFPPVLIPILTLVFCLFLHRGLANYVKRA